ESAPRALDSAESRPSSTAACAASSAKSSRDVFATARTHQGSDGVLDWPRHHRRGRPVRSTRASQRVVAQVGASSDHRRIGGGLDSDPVAADLIGLREVAAMLGVSGTTALEYARTSDFPTPIRGAVSGSGPVWNRRQVEDWLGLAAEASEVAALDQ